MSTTPAAASEWDLPAEACLTVSEYYRAFLEPERLRRLSPRTVETDRTALKRWTEHGASWAKEWSSDSWGRRRWKLTEPRRRLTDPPIGLIVDDDLGRFVDDLLADGYSEKTVATTIRHLRVIFSQAGPREGRHSRAADVLLMRPAFPELGLVLRQNWIPQAEDVSAVFQAAALLPDRSRNLVRALIAFASVYGLRPVDLAALRWGPNLNPDDLSEVRWTPSKTRRFRPFPMLAPVPVWLQDLLSVIPASHGGRVFGPYNKIRALWSRCARRAGLSEWCVDRNGRRSLKFSLKSLRRFANARANSIQAGAGNWLLGHGVDARGDRVNHVHYSEVYRAPEWVGQVLSNLRLAEPFVGVSGGVFETG